MHVQIKTIFFNCFNKTKKDQFTIPLKSVTAEGHALTCQISVLGARPDKVRPSVLE